MSENSVFVSEKTCSIWHSFAGRWFYGIFHQSITNWWWTKIKYYYSFVFFVQGNATMLEENYRYIAVVFMVTTLYNIQQASGGPNRVCTPGTFRRGPHPLGICGSFIDDILDTLCFNGFNGRRKKRGITSEGGIKTKFTHFFLGGVSSH